MTQSPFDQLAKQYLEEFLSPIGTVDGLRPTIGHQECEIPGEAKYIWFKPKVIASFHGLWD